MARNYGSPGASWATRPVAAALVLVLGGIAQVAAASTGPTPPFGLSDKGRLDLTLVGSTNNVRYFSTAAGSSASITQALATIRRNDCRLDMPANAARLLNFEASQNGNPAPVGLVSGSMGVYSGSQGTPCARFSASKAHDLTVSLGSAAPANAFYRLELDIEAKGNLALELQILLGTVVTDRYELRTGSSIVEGEGVELGILGPNLPAVPGSARIFNCRAPRASDSGPDAGALDNCRWIVNELGQGFRLLPLRGEGSLEGGSDTGIVSRVYLTDAEIGALGCGPQSQVPIAESTNTIGDGENDAQCTVTRVDPTPFGGQCTQAVAYLFRNLNEGAEGCELVKAPGEQLAASIRIQFPREPWTSLESAPSRTQIGFSDGNGGFVDFEPDRCIGTVDEDPNGTRTIVEVLQSGGFGPAVDQVRPGDPNDPVVDWACILDNEEIYVGPPAGEDGPYEMQVIQTILFWGDIRFSRQ